MKSNVVLSCENIEKDFQDPVLHHVLKNVSLSVDQGEFVSITGKSGCGKSTLLYILSTMDTDYSGSVFIDGENIKGKRENDLARIRNEKIGFVFQFHYLLNEFTVLENVMLPAQKLGKLTKHSIVAKAKEKLEMLGIGELDRKKPNQLSGGEKQRVAIARALINSPAIILCDEPTGNLDKGNSTIVFEIFKELVGKNGQTILVVTHDDDFAANTHRIIRMEDGCIVHPNDRFHRGHLLSATPSVT